MTEKNDLTWYEVRLTYRDGSKRTVITKATDPEDAEWRAIQGEPEGTIPHAYAKEA